jgi:small-conductance mechanosensitive channel
MTVYAIILFVHVTAVLVLSAALSFELLSLFHLRRAASMAEARPWINPVPRLPLLAGGSVLVILFTGGYLVMTLSASGRAWPKVAVVALLLMGPPAAMTGKRMRAIRGAFATAKAMNSELVGRLRDPFLKVSLGIRIAVFLGIFLLVNAKPGLWESITIIGASVVFGLVASLLASRKNPSLSVSGRAEVGD